MQVDQITPLLLTFNEAPNIGRALERLAWANEIVVVDSFSTDTTLDIVHSFPRVRQFQRDFDSHTSQWNYGLAQVTSEWVLSLDADYLVPEGFPQCVSTLASGNAISSYKAAFRYMLQGRPLRGALYPPRSVLFRPTRCRYVQDGHTQLLQVNGEELTLPVSFDHDDRKPLGRWLKSQGAYAQLEAVKLLSTPHDRLGWKDRLRTKVVMAPILTGLYCLFAKRLILDGWPGVYYSLQRVYAELLLSLELLDRRLTGGKRSRD